MLMWPHLKAVALPPFRAGYQGRVVFDNREIKHARQWLRIQKRPDVDGHVQKGAKRKRRESTSDHALILVPLDVVKFHQPLQTGTAVFSTQLAPRSRLSLSEAKKGIGGNHHFR